MMEVHDEAVDMADMDDLSMAILEPVPAQPDHVGNVTITINSKGEINVDQTALATILGSGQQSARVTFVRVGEEGATIENQVDLDASELLAAVGGQVDGGLAQDSGAGVGSNAMLLLDQDQMRKLESVLESDEAKNILGEAGSEVADEIVEASAAKGVEQQERKQVGPMRRSQRQVDRETRQTVEKIRAENQEIMRKEDPNMEKEVAAGPRDRPECQDTWRIKNFPLLESLAQDQRVTVMQEAGRAKTIQRGCGASASSLTTTGS